MIFFLLHTDAGAYLSDDDETGIELHSIFRSKFFIAIIYSQDLMKIQLTMVRYMYSYRCFC